MRGVTKWTNKKKGLKIHRAECAQVNIVETWPGSLKKSTGRMHKEIITKIKQEVRTVEDKETNR